MDWPTHTGIFAAGDTPLASGEVLRDARLSWKTHGTLSLARDNVVALPLQLLRPAHGPRVADRAGRRARPGALVHRHPRHVRQRPVVEPVEHAGLPVPRDHPRTTSGSSAGSSPSISASTGWPASTAGRWARIQAYHWAALFPDAVERAIVVCGGARTADAQPVFLAGLMATLEAAPEHLGGGRFSAEPAAAKRAFGRIYAGWALSQDFYRAGLHLHRPPQLGAPDLDTFIRTRLGGGVRAPSAANLYAQLRDLGDGRHQRQRPLSAATWSRALRRDPRARAADARRDRPLLPGRRQRGRAAPPAPRRAAADPEHLGPPGRQPEGEPRGHRVPPDGSPQVDGPLGVRPGASVRPFPAKSENIGP